MDNNEILGKRPFLDEISDGFYISHWRNGNKTGETFTEPSMVEPVHNLSIEEILRDYSRGITHSTREGFFDDGDEIVAVDNYDDITDFIGTTSNLPPASAGAAQLADESQPTLGAVPASSQNPARSDKEEA